MTAERLYDMLLKASSIVKKRDEQAAALPCAGPYGSGTSTAGQPFDCPAFSLPWDVRVREELI